MYGSGGVFGGLIRFFVWAWFPVDVELALLGTIADPMESRVKTTRFLLAYVILYNTVRCGVICFDTGFHWISYRDKQGQFDVYWKPGPNNKADYVTKHHPSAVHR